MNEQPTSGDVIEFFSNNHGLLVGNTDSIPPVRRVARISYVQNDGTIVAFDVDGLRCVLAQSTPVRVLARKQMVTGGWGSL